MTDIRYMLHPMLYIAYLAIILLSVHLLVSSCMLTNTAPVGTLIRQFLRHVIFFWRSR